MTEAFVLISADPGSEDEVLKDLKKIQEVEEAYFAYGVYDIIAKVGAESIDNLKEIITSRIRRLDKVKTTLTLIIMEEE